MTLKTMEMSLQVGVVAHTWSHFFSLTLVPREFHVFTTVEQAYYFKEV